MVNETYSISESDYNQIKHLCNQSGMRNLRLNTRIIYQYWKAVFGVNKVPNGCPSCMRTDLTNFAHQFKMLDEKGYWLIEKDNS